MNEAAPKSSPMAKDPEPCLREAKVENTSGEPFEKAKKVTPAWELRTNEEDGSQE